MLYRTYTLPLPLKLLCFFISFLLSFLHTYPFTPDSPSPPLSLSLKFPSAFLTHFEIATYSVHQHSNSLVFSLKKLNQTQNCPKNPEFSCYSIDSHSKLRLLLGYSQEKNDSLCLEMDFPERSIIITSDHSQRLSLDRDYEVKVLDDFSLMFESIIKSKFLVVELDFSPSDETVSSFDAFEFFSSFGSFLFLLLILSKSIFEPIIRVACCQKALNDIFSLEFGENKRVNKIDKIEGFGTSFFEFSKKKNKKDIKQFNLSMSIPLEHEKGANKFLINEENRPYFNQIKPKLLPSEYESDFANSSKKKIRGQGGVILGGNSIGVAESEKVSIKDLKLDLVLTTPNKQQQQKTAMKLSLDLKFFDYFLLFLQKFGFKTMNKRIDLFLKGREKLLKGLDPLNIYRRLEEAEKLKLLVLDPSQLRVFNEYLRTCRVVLGEVEENKKADFTGVCQNDNFSTFSFNMDLIKSFRVIRERIENNVMDRRLLTLLDRDFVNAMEKMNFE